jgi:hypothetical protein
LGSFIASGMAARTLVAPTSAYSEELARAARGGVSEAIHTRQQRLASHLDQLTEAQAQGILDRAQYPRKSRKNARESLRDYIRDAQTESSLGRLESAFFRQP